MAMRRRGRLSRYGPSHAAHGEATLPSHASSAPVSAVVTPSLTRRRCAAETSGVNSRSAATRPRNGFAPRSSTPVRIFPRIFPDSEHACELGFHADGGGLSPASHTPGAELGHDHLEPRRQAMIVARSLFAIAATARDREVSHVVGATLGSRPDVLERRGSKRPTVAANRELGVAVDALAHPCRSSVERGARERRVGDRSGQQQEVTARHVRQAS
jgi:hypothetical protein